MSDPAAPEPAADRRRRLEEAMAEYLIEADAGRAPTPEAFLVRFPDLRAELTEFLIDQAALARIIRPLRGFHVGRPDELTARASNPSTLQSQGVVGSTEERRPDHALTTKFDSEAAEARGGFQPVRVRYFGDYELRSVLGKGGMGIVYRARQVSLNRLVALKMIKTGMLADSEELRRFRNEAEAVAQLDHPGIVPIYEVGEHDGQRYFSMKLVEGGSLAERLVDFRDDPRTTAFLVAETAEAVHHAHVRGILHRDLKPANIVIDAEGRPHVTDFGLSRKLESELELTAVSAVIGTPAYMSPEQTRGRKGVVTTASDVYGLGSVLYALLTGRAPFRADNMADMMTQVREQAPEAPRRINPKVPRDLEVICLKCLEKDPRLRYDSARALSNDLRAWLERCPIAARPVGPLRRSWLWCRRRPAVAALTAAVVLAVVGGVAGVIAVQARANRDLASKNAELAASETKVRARFELAVDAIRTFHSGVSEDFLLKEDEFRELRQRLLKSAEEFYRKLGTMLENQTDRVSQKMLAQSYHDLAELIGAIGRKPEAVEMHRRVLAVREVLAQGPDADVEDLGDVARSHMAIAFLLSEIGKAEETLAAHHEARKLLEEVVARTPNALRFDSRLAKIHRGYWADLASTQASIGWWFARLGKTGEALTWQMRGLAGREALHRADPTSRVNRDALARSHATLGQLYSRTGKSSLARQSHEAAREIRLKLVEEAPDNARFAAALAQSHMDIAIFDDTRGKTSEALESSRAALEIQRRLVETYPAVARNRSELGRIHHRIGMELGWLGRRNEALAEYRANLEIRERLAADHPEVSLYRSDLAQALYTLGGSHAENGEPVEALAAYERARALWRDLAAAHPDLTEYRRQLAICLQTIGLRHENAGRWDEAMTIYREARDLLAKLVEDTPDIPRHHNLLASIEETIGTLHSKRGRPDEALAAFERSLVVRRKLAVDQPTIVAYRSELGRAYNALGWFHYGNSRLVEGLAAHEASREVRRALANEFPSVIGYQSDLAQSHYMVSQVLTDLGRLSEAIEADEASLAILRKLVETDPKVVSYRDRLAWGYHSIGRHLGSLGRSEEGLDALRRAVPIWRKLIVDSPETVRFRQGLSWGLFSLGSGLAEADRASEALRHVREAVEIRRAECRNRPDNPQYRQELARTLTGLASTLTMSGREAAGADVYREASAIWEGLLAAMPDTAAHRHDLALAQSALGDVLVGMGRLAEARTAYERVRSLLRGAADTPQVPGSRMRLASAEGGLGDVLRAEGRPIEAIASYREALALREALLRDFPENELYRGFLARGLRRLALARIETGDLAGAAADLRRALTLSETAMNRDGYTLFEVACMHATLASLAGRSGSGVSTSEGPGAADRAMELLRAALTLGRRAPGPFRTERALDSLRNRDDFRRLLLDLAFPDDPFAP